MPPNSGPTFIGVNGISSHGHGNTDQALLQLAERGGHIRDIDLPKRHFVSAWWGAEADAKLIAAEARDGDFAIGHSFGCLRIAKAMESIRFSAVFLFRPAMDPDYRFPGDCPIYCFHSRDDWPIRIGSRIPFHPFGRAGCDGFTETSDRIINRQTRGGHSADFEEPRLSQFIDYIWRVSCAQ